MCLAIGLRRTNWREKETEGYGGKQKKDGTRCTHCGSVWQYEEADYSTIQDPSAFNAGYTRFPLTYASCVPIHIRRIFLALFLFPCFLFLRYLTEHEIEVRFPRRYEQRVTREEIYV